MASGKSQKHLPTLRTWAGLRREIESCVRCPRLRDHCEEVARLKRRAYLEESYWGKPVAGFGDAQARLILVGLAPAAHGANRTGRIFTGDRSGEWLYRALHRAGFANQPTSVSRDDGLELCDAFVTCAARCAPPANKPLPEEIERCSVFLDAELDLLIQRRVYLALGGIGLNTIWDRLIERKEVTGTRPRFSHGGIHPLPNGRHLLMSYHPSQQNTFTGRLTEPMLDAVFTKARELIGPSAPTN